jgi:hypothetical protein
MFNNTPFATGNHDRRKKILRVESATCSYGKCLIDMIWDASENWRAAAWVRAGSNG